MCIDDKINKILYLDCDVICNGPLDELVDYNLNADIACVIPDSPEMQERVKKLDYGIEFINYFPTEDYELSVLLLDKDDEYKYRINRDIIVNYIGFDNEFYHSLASMYTLPGKIIKKMQINKFVGMYDMLANHAKAPLESYDIALDFYGYGAFTTAFLALKVDAKVKATWIHDEYMPWLANSKRYFDKIDKICCVSDAIKTVFDVKFPNYTDKSLVIYNVIDKERIIKQSITG